MSISRLLLATSLATCASPPFTVVAQGQVEPSPSDAEVKEQIKRLDPKNAVPGRLEALKWLDRHSGAKNANQAISTLEHCIRKDPDVRVRGAAVQSLALIANNRQDPCPLAVIQAMLDKDDNLSQIANHCAGLFKSFAPGSVEVLLGCAISENAEVRGGCLCHLARAAGKEKRVLEVIEKRTHDKSFLMRHNAHCAMFLATDNLGEFLTYLIRLQDDPDSVLGQVDANSKEGKLELFKKNVASIGIAMLIIEWSDKRPDDLAPALLKLLEAPSPIVRRGAVRLIGATAAKVDEASLRKRLLELGQEPAKPHPRPEKSKVASRLEKLKVEDRLRGLRDIDPNESVRAAAGIALQRLARVQQKGGFKGSP